MGNKSSSNRRKVHGDENEKLLQEFSNWFPEIKAEPYRSGHWADHGVSLELVNRSLQFIKYVNRRSMKPRRVSPRDAQKDELLSLLNHEFLQLSVGADRFLGTLLANMKNMNEELRELLDAILNWTPSRHRQEEILERLGRFRSGESFSEQFLQSFRELMEQHKEMLEKVRRQGSSLEKKVKKTKWLRKLIYTIFAGFFVAALICSIIATALHASPILATIVAVATSAASWGPLALWVDELWVKKLNELQLIEKGPFTMAQGAEVDKERILRELEPICRLVNMLKHRLENMHTTEELRSMQERLQKELCEAVHCINDSVEKLEECKRELDDSRNNFLNWMIGGGKSNGDQSSESKLLLGS